MTDIVDVQDLRGDNLLVSIRRSLATEPSYDLAEDISSLLNSRDTLGRVVIFDVRQANVTEADADIIIKACRRVANIGAAPLIVDSSRLDEYWDGVRVLRSIDQAFRVLERESPIPVQVFLEDESSAKEVEEALREVLKAYAITYLDGPPPVYGSWYRQLIGWTRNPNASWVSADLKRAIDIQLVERYQAGIDAATSNAVATLITALEKTPGAIIQAGSVMLVKFDDAVIVRQLTQREMLYWQQNPGLFKDPRRALIELENATNTPDELNRPLFGS